MVAREEDVPEPGTLHARRARRRPAHHRAWPGRRDPARLPQRLPPPRHRGRRGAVRQGRPPPVPVPRLDLRPRWPAHPGQAHRGPRRLQLRGRTASRPSTLDDVAGLRLPEPRSEMRRAARPTSWATSSITRAASTSPRSARPSGSSTTSKSNWKFIAENYSECYHCPGVHPQLNKLTPYDLGGDFDPDGAWQGGWMELVESAPRRWRSTAATARATAGRRCTGSRPRTSAGSTTTSSGRWRFLSIHPDYLLVHRLVPQGAGSHDGHLRLAVRGGDDRGARLRPVRRRRVLGPHQPPGLARLRAPAARHAVVVLGRRPLLQPGGVGPRVRPDARRPLRRRVALDASGSSASTTTSRCPRRTAASRPTRTATSREPTDARLAARARAGSGTAT